MFIPIPTAPPAPPSPEAQELGRHLTDVIHAYQADHPNMSSLEVRQAIQLARQTGGGTDAKMARQAIAVGLVAMMGLGLFVLRSNPDMGQVPWVLVAVGVVFVVLAVAAIRASRR
jgi:hypothetical protein